LWVILRTMRVCAHTYKVMSFAVGILSTAMAWCQAPVSADTLARKNHSFIQAPIEYSCKDSIVLLKNGTAMLHGESDLKYQTMELTSDFIRVKMDSSLIYARGTLDTIDNELIGSPVFKEGNDSYESKELTYNLKTQKGLIREVVTEQGEGYIVADKTKKTGKDEMAMSGGRYTTCDNHEHPHFYLQMTKAKVKPGDYIATGPAYLVVGDVPMPLAVPFGFFPFTSKYSSGLIMPTFGDDYSRGLYLRGLGYYFALNDYMDLELTGDIYTKGTWAVYASSKYIKRYKFSGNLSINYRWDVTGEKGLPDYSVAKNLRIQWTHQQDAKANPYSTFSASVNFSTSGYNRSNINSYYNGQLNSENTKSSSISYTQRFPDSPWMLSLSAMVSQQTRDSTLTLTLPDLSVSMSSIYPFKRKVKVGKERWYEKIKLSYSGNARIAVNNIKEDYLFKSDFLKDWKTGIKHNVPISASWTVLKYLNITPSITMTDRMYFQREDREWNEATQSLQRDTTAGFFNVFDFNASVSFSTKLYGFYTPSKKLFPKSKVEKFRHVFTPTMSFTYKPDFGTEGWGYYGKYNETVYYADSVDEFGRKVPKLDEMGNPMYVTQEYSRYQNGMYGTASKGLQANLSFSLGNNLEMKMRNDKDSTGNNPYKVVSIIDAFNITGGYNFAADSMNWNNFGVNLRIKIPKVNYTINLSTSLDPYMYELNALGNPVRTNKQYWSNGMFPHWSGTSTSLSYTLTSEKVHKWIEQGRAKNGGKAEGQRGGKAEGGKAEGGKAEGLEPIENMDNGQQRNTQRNSSSEGNVRDGYVITEIPWSISASYTVSYRSGSTFDYDKMKYKMEFVQNLSFSGNIALGKGWKATATTSVDLKAMKLSYTNFTVSRDLHCWSMSASFVPFGPYKSYTFHIGVNASMLADLKYDKSSTSSTNEKVNWW